MAFNRGDIDEISRVVNYFAHDQCAMRSYDPVGSRDLHGSNNIIKFFQSLLTSYPDGMFLLKKFSTYQENGFNIVKSYVHFTGTLVADHVGNYADITMKEFLPSTVSIVGASSNNNNNKTKNQDKDQDKTKRRFVQVLVKACIKKYLDAQNKLVLYEKKVKSVSYRSYYVSDM